MGALWALWATGGSLRGRTTLALRRVRSVRAGSQRLTVLRSGRLGAAASVVILVAAIAALVSRDDVAAAGRSVLESGDADNRARKELL